MGIATLHYQLTKNCFYLALMACCGFLIHYQFDLITLVVLLCAIMVIFYVKNEYGILSFFGSISYSMYLIYSLVFIYVNGIARKIFNVTNQYELFYFIINLLVVIGICYLLNLVLEKPFIKLSKKLSYK